MLRATLHEQEIRRAIDAPDGGELVVDGVASLDAGDDRCLYFVNGELTAAVRESLAARQGCIVIVPRGSAGASELGSCRVLEASDPRASIAKVLTFIRRQKRQSPWVGARRIAPDAVISPLAVVEGNVEIGEGAVIEPFCTVGPDVAIGRGSVLRAGARVGPRVLIGQESIIGLNAVLGSEGFGFVRDEAGHKLRIPHLGGIIIGSHVELGSLSLVQYGTIAPTIIEDHVKIDDCVAVGHNAHVARGASVTAGVVIGGSAVIGAEAWIGINSSIRNGCRVGFRALVGMDGSVQKDLPDHMVARARARDLRMHRDEDDGTAIGFAAVSRRRD